MLAFITFLIRSDGCKELEILVLLHELHILRRQVAWPRLQPADRALFGAISRMLPRSIWPVFCIKPELAAQYPLVDLYTDDEVAYFKEIALGLDPTVPTFLEQADPDLMGARSADRADNEGVQVVVLPPMTTWITECNAASVKSPRTAKRLQISGSIPTSSIWIS